MASSLLRELRSLIVTPGQTKNIKEAALAFFRSRARKGFLRIDCSFWTASCIASFSYHLACSPCPDTTICRFRIP